MGLYERKNGKWVKTVGGGGIAGGASGLTDAEKTLLITILRNAVYSTNQSTNITALETLFNVSGGTEPDVPVDPDIPDEPGEPDVPVVTLTGITATYSGGDVAVGTAVTALTGIVVTAQYSDGSTQTVTDYTLSGTIVEGENTITVTYEGMTATFTVAGVAESADNLLNSALVTYENTSHNYYSGQRIYDDEKFTTYVVPIEAGTYRLTVYNAGEYGNDQIGGNHAINSLANLTPIESIENKPQNCYGVNTGDYNTLVRGSYKNVGTVQPVSTGPLVRGTVSAGRCDISVDITYDRSGWVLVTVPNSKNCAFEKVVA